MVDGLALEELFEGKGALVGHWGVGNFAVLEGVFQLHSPNQIYIKPMRMNPAHKLPHLQFTL